jgi:hypothetical protein
VIEGAKAFKTLQPQIQEIFGKLSLKNIIGSAGSFIKSVPGRVGDFAGGVVDWVKMPMKEKVSTAKDAISGFMSGGAGGAILGLITSSKSFQKILDNINPILQMVSDTFGKLIEPLLPIVNLLGTILAPILDIFGQMLSQLLLPLMKPLFEGLKWLGVAVLWVAKVLGEFRNKVIDMIQGLLRGIGNLELFGKKPFGFLLGVADNMNNLKVDTDKLGQAMENLENMTWDQSMAAAQAAANTEKASESMRNVPEIFKAALTRGDVARGVAPSNNGSSGSKGISSNDKGINLTVNFTISDGVVDQSGVKGLVRRGILEAAEQLSMARYGVSGAVV